MDIELSKVSPTAIKDTNIRKETGAVMNTLISFLNDGYAVGERRYIATLAPEFKKYADSFIGLYRSMKADGKNNEPIILVPLDEEERQRAATSEEYGIIDGHTRFAIATALGFSTIGAYIAERRDRAGMLSAAVQSNRKTGMTMKELKAVALKLLSIPRHHPNGAPVLYERNSKNHKAGDPVYPTKQEVANQMGVSEAMVRKYLKWSPAGERKPGRPKDSRPARAEFRKNHIFCEKDFPAVTQEEIETFSTEDATVEDTVRLYDRAKEAERYYAGIAALLKTDPAADKYIKKRRSSLATEARYGKTE